MYDGQWTMVRTCCAADYCGVIDIGGNRIRRGCQDTPAFQSAFCSSCKENFLTTCAPSNVDPESHVDFVNELYKLNYLNQDEYFIEAIIGSRIQNGTTEVEEYIQSIKFQINHSFDKRFDVNFFFSHYF